MRILVSAYACEPEKGSEPGVGWMWCRLLTRFGDVTVITRANNRDVIEASSIPEASKIEFQYVDLPEWARKWKRGGRGARLYYILWQFAALRRARSLVAKDRFDLTWHVTIANAWLGSTLSLLSIPGVFGPVSGGVPSCWQVSLVGRRGLLSEISRSLIKTIFRYANPLARLSWRRAALVLTNNNETLRWLPRRHHHKCEVFPNVLLEAGTGSMREKRPDSRRIIYAGYLLPLKGLSLALRAMMYLEGWALDVYGEGPDRARLERLAGEWGVADRVRFHGWVPRRDVFEAMTQEAACLLFPSLHDEVGWVVAEALTHGLPVVCVDRGGPQALGGRAVPLKGLDDTARSLAQEIQRISTDLGAEQAPADWSPTTRSQALRAILEARRLTP